VTPVARLIQLLTTAGALAGEFVGDFAGVFARVTVRVMARGMATVTATVTARIMATITATIMTRLFAPASTVILVVALTGAAVAQAPAWMAMQDDPWMTEDAMRAAFVGKTLDGHYGNGLSFTETYFAGGQLEYRETARQAHGRWHFRGHVFCTFYDASKPQPQLNGGCWTAVKRSANCYDFYLAGLAPDPPFEDETANMADRWSARGWRSEEPSTCSEKPIV
jgi:hypothetical protein